MFYSYKTIAERGFNSLTDFLHVYISTHPNCEIIPAEDGVYIDHDFGDQPKPERHVATANLWGKMAAKLAQTK